MSDQFDYTFAEGEELLDQISAAVNADERRVMIMNFPRMKQMQLAYAILKKIFDGNKSVTVGYALNKPYKSMGYIKLEGDDLSFDDPALFVQVASLADNVEAYPIHKTKVRMNLTFHNLTKGV